MSIQSSPDSRAMPRAAFWNLLWVAVCTTGAALPSGLAQEPVKGVTIVRMHAHALVSGAQIRLHDVATLEGATDGASQLATLVVGRTPSPGKERFLSQRDLRATLARGMPGTTLEWAGETRTRVRAHALKIPGRELADAAVERIKERFAKRSNMTVTVDIITVPKDILLRPGSVEFQPELSPGTPRPGRKIIRVRILRDGRWLSEATVSVRVRAFQEVAVATRRIDAREVLEASDVRLEKREIKGREWNSLSSPSEWIGKRARFSLRAGRVLETRLLENNPVILKGDRVIVSVSRGSLVIKATAVAQSEAARGETVLLRLIDGGAVVRAQAIEAGSASL